MNTTATLTQSEKTIVLREARKDFKAIQRMLAEYREDCKQAARDGYRPHYCIHGTNLWTDYDNICGPCEDGESQYYYAALTPAEVMAQTLSRYRSEKPEIDRKIKEITAAAVLLNTLDRDGTANVLTPVLNIIAQVKGRWA